VGLIKNEGFFRHNTVQGVKLLFETQFVSIQEGTKSKETVEVSPLIFSACLKIKRFDFCQCYSDLGTRMDDISDEGATQERNGFGRGENTFFE
jgi:hypothetical protein